MGGEEFSEVDFFFFERERETAFNGLSVYDTAVLNEHLFLVMLGPVTNFWMGKDWGGVSQFI